MWSYFDLMVSKISNEKLKKFTKLLLEWGNDNLRDFKWRNSTNPYEILIAEMMLQRTKAEQVAAIYDSFLERFSDVKKLANSDTEEIKKVIKPLGLEYRAKRIKEVAEAIVKDHDSTVPASEKELLELPGIGRYISGAVLSIAFKKDVPIFDSNVARILQRVFSMEITAESHKKKEFWDFMGQMVPEGRAKEFNLALIDFGSLICTPRNAKCENCPLANICDCNN